MDEADPLRDIVARRDEHAADHVGMAIQILGRRVQDDVGAELQGLLEERRGERVVDHEQRVGLACDLARRREIAQSHHRIGRRLGVHDLGVRRDGGGNCPRVTAVDERERQAEPGPDVGHLAM